MSETRLACRTVGRTGGSADGAAVALWRGRGLRRRASDEVPVIAGEGE